MNFVDFFYFILILIIKKSLIFQYYLIAILLSKTDKFAMLIIIAKFVPFLKLFINNLLIAIVPL